MATGVQSWSKTAATNASADSAVNFAEGQAPSSVNDSARGLMASVAKWRDDTNGTITTGGSSTAYTATSNQSFASESAMDGARLTLKFNATSGASPTLAVDGLTARAIQTVSGTAVPTGLFTSGSIWDFTFVNSIPAWLVNGVAGVNNLSTIDIIGGTQLTAPAADDTLPIYDLSETANRRILVSDFLKVINELSADSSPDSAADYVVTYDASATAAKKVLLSVLPSSLPRGYIDGCIISNGTDTTNDINIAAGKCRDSTDTVDITVPAITGKQLDANWAAGGSAGMRNSAAGIANTTYHIYAVRTATSATADIYAHTSTTVATVLTALQAETGGSSYAYARRIGSIIRAGAAILQFVQFGDDFFLKTPTLDVNTGAPGTSAVTVAMGGIPLGIRVLGRFNVGYTANNGGIYLSPTDTTDLAASSGNAPLATLFQGTWSANSNLGGQATCLTDTSAQIRYRINVDNSVRIVTLGWTDVRGKDS